MLGDFYEEIFWSFARPHVQRSEHGLVRDLKGLQKKDHLDLG